MYNSDNTYIRALNLQVRINMKSAKFNVFCLSTMILDILWQAVR